MEGSKPLRTVTVNVVVRHGTACKDRKKGSSWKKCNCRKSIIIYEGRGSGKNRRESAKTRSWAKAEERAQEILDSFNPDKQELKQLRAKKERERIPVADAVGLYIQDMAARLGDNGTCRMARSLFGNIDLKTKAVIKNGHLFDWLDTLIPDARPVAISDFTSIQLSEWRASWKFDSDLTTSNRWVMVKGFFRFCEAQGWIEDTPCRKLGDVSVKKGNRTAIFTDEQYDKILATIPEYDPENVPKETRRSWQKRLTIVVELLRWSGMAIVDAVLFRPDSVGTDGVLRYRRQKSDELAIVPLPDHVLQLLKDIPLERDSIGPEQPFRTNVLLASDTARWAHRIGELFELAGITEVRTGVETVRKPHVHMLRDTFAVWHLRHGTHLHTVSKMLGHAKTATTERSYLPWVKELETAHIADARRAFANNLSR